MCAVLKNRDGRWGVYCQRYGVSATVWGAVDRYLCNGVWDERAGQRLDRPQIDQKLQRFPSGRAAVAELVDAFIPGALKVRKDRRHGWRAELL